MVGNQLKHELRILDTFVATVSGVLIGKSVIV